MSVTQLSVFIENKPGRLSEATRILGVAGVNIRGFSIADTEDYGILRLLVDNEALAKEALRNGTFTVHESQVILAKVPDRPGGFAEVLDAFSAVGVNVEYTYATVHSLIAFGVEQAQACEGELSKRGIHLLNDKELGSL
jgi:hypothetical protein